MKKGKLTAGIGGIYAILFGVFQLLVFTVFHTRTSVFWVSYAFMTIAFGIQIVSMVLAFRPMDIETAFFGIPLASFSLYYLGAALTVGAVFMIFQNAGVVLAVVIQLLIASAFLVIAILSLLSRDVVQSIGENVKQNVVAHKSVLVELEMLAASCSDPVLCQTLSKLIDTVRYADPISTSATESIEQRITREISALRVSMDNGQIADAVRMCGEIELLYMERNKKLALSK